MTRTVHCRKYDTDLPGLAKPPMPGKRGEAIFEEISERAWTEWQALQTRLINEKGLNMIDREHRQYLGEQMERFFSNEATDEADGYEPEADDNTPPA